MDLNSNSNQYHQTCMNLSKKHYWNLIFFLFFCVQLLGHVNRKENRNAYSYKFMDSNLAARSKEKRPPKKRKKKKSLIWKSRIFGSILINLLDYKFIS